MWKALWDFYKMKSTKQRVIGPISWEGISVNSGGTADSGDCLHAGIHWCLLIILPHRTRNMVTFSSMYLNLQSSEVNKSI